MGDCERKRLAEWCREQAKIRRIPPPDWRVRVGEAENFEAIAAALDAGWLGAAPSASFMRSLALWFEGRKPPVILALMSEHWDAPFLLRAMADRMDERAASGVRDAAPPKEG